MASSLIRNFLNLFVKKSGDTMTGDLNINADLDVDSGTLYVDSTNNRVGIGTTLPAESLTAVGNFNVQNLSSAPSKAYRFRTTGSQLDLDGAGASLYLSVYDNGDFSGTQRIYSIYGTGSSYVTNFNLWEWKDQSNNLKLQIVPDSSLVKFFDGVNIETGTTTGTKIGTATTQKLGFFNATPVVQQNGTGSTAGFTNGSGTNITADATFTGGVGTTAYTVDDVVKALKNLGLLAQ